MDFIDCGVTPPLPEPVETHIAMGWKIDLSTIQGDLGLSGLFAGLQVHERFHEIR